MGGTTLELDLPVAIYQMLEKQPLQIRQTAIELAIRTIADYLEREAQRAAGRALLLQLPEEARKYDDQPPHNLAERHNDYIYGEE